MADQIEADAEFLERLERAVRNLPRQQREVFLAHRLDGMSYAEIAAEIGLTEKAVQRQMARALYNLDRQMCGYKLRWWQRWL